MFDPSSRYYRIEDATYDPGDGHDVIYKRRRFLPDGDQMPRLAVVTVRHDERLDLIAARAYNQPDQFWRIADANNAIDPWDLTDEAGREVIVPIPQAQ